MEQIAPMQEELSAALMSERDRLRQSLDRLNASIRTLSESQGEESGPGGVQADVASDLAEQYVDQGVALLERERLAEVEAALKRQAEGTYGLCEKCARPIPIERLQVVPWTRYCRDCAQ